MVSDECNQGRSAPDEGDRPTVGRDSRAKQKKYRISLQVSRPTHRGGGEIGVQSCFPAFTEKHKVNVNAITYGCSTGW